MKKLVYHSKFVEVFYEEDYSLLSKKWHSETKNMDESTYKEEMLNYAELVKKYNCQKELVDTQEFLFIIKTDLQIWYEQNIVSVYLEYGMTNAALISSVDFIGQLALEQAMDEGLAQKLNKRFFDNETDAREWLLSE